MRLGQPTHKPLLRGARALVCPGMLGCASAHDQRAAPLEGCLSVRKYLRLIRCHTQVPCTATDPCTVTGLLWLHRRGCTEATKGVIWLLEIFAVVGPLLLASACHGAAGAAVTVVHSIPHWGAMHALMVSALHLWPRCSVLGTCHVSCCLGLSSSGASRHC